MKRSIALIFAAILILALAPNISAAGTELSSLTVIMKYGGTALRGINLVVCRVAGANEENGGTTYTAVQDFAGAGADFTGIGDHTDPQTKEKNIALAATLNAYAYANTIARSSNATDKDGKAVFTGLAAGLYLVAQTGGENSEFAIAPYLVEVPAPGATDDGQGHHVVTYPKSERRHEASTDPQVPTQPATATTGAVLGTSGDHKDPGGPKTGDTANMQLWITLILVSVMGLGITVFAAKPKRIVRKAARGSAEACQ